MNHLPVELLLKILNEVRGRSGFTSIPLVCSLWSELFVELDQYQAWLIVRVFPENKYKLSREILHSATRCISTAEINAYLESTDDLMTTFNSFKEDVIDALSDSTLVISNEVFSLALPTKPTKFDLSDLMLKAQNRIRGDIFLYPEGAYLVGEYPEDLYGRRGGNYGTEGGFQVSVRTWITSDASRNWSTHGHPLLTERIDELLPVSLFMGKKEGDTIQFVFEEWDIKLTLKQRPYRYGVQRYDSDICFDRVLKNALKADTGVCSTVPHLSRAEQLRMLKAAYAEYCKSFESN